MKTLNYQTQQKRWPDSGHHILAQFDEDCITVYQAYRASIAHYAVQHQAFGGDFSYNRMSWIKPNFLWMMYRSGWAQKEGQEHILAIKLRRSFFDEILKQAVASSFDADRYANTDDWKSALTHSDVRLQWDPDHDPKGKPVTRRAVQLGPRGDMLRRYGGNEILSIEDVSAFVVMQRHHVEFDPGVLEVPLEEEYSPRDAAAAKNVGVDVGCQNAC